MSHGCAFGSEVVAVVAEADVERSAAEESENADIAFVVLFQWVDIRGFEEETRRQWQRRTAPAEKIDDDDAEIELPIAFMVWFGGFTLE